MSVRTNNDIEGWHRRINDCAHGSANCLPAQVKLICEGKLKRFQSTLKLFKLHSLWNANDNGDVSSSQFLKR
ncbi:hypothetical protein KUTeg_021745 [Tegillarca granosa]|uniref:Uncharacterized protein n=1 Tax=Tegillarca granosa TaxID=220873 RepID=A0ABQ9E761_TEGGR|nr:hypothetical protein KUTeg_021745 [Tegillarca granosa]